MQLRLARCDGVLELIAFGAGFERLGFCGVDPQIDFVVGIAFDRLATALG